MPNSTYELLIGIFNQFVRNRHEDDWDLTIQPVTFPKINSVFIGKSGQNLSGMMVILV
jgi:hypothetical protein